MVILLTGASGFIGRYLLADLRAAGHRVIPAVRRTAETDALLASPASIAVDFNRDTRMEDWLPRLHGIDVVINCAGILQGKPGQSMAAIHAAAPQALFAACKSAGVARVMQISAISADEAANTVYAATKKSADDFLMGLDLDWVILRPSLVYAEGAYGGTAFLRALAALPWIIPVVGRGDQVFQPIHVDDLTAMTRRAVEDRSISRVVLSPAGPERLTLREILIRLRRWLGLPPARVVDIPRLLVRIAARLGDLAGGPVNTTALRQLDYGNAASAGAATTIQGICPRSFDAALAARPAQAQDRSHARLYFLRPVLRWGLAILWVVSGLVGLVQSAAIIARFFVAIGFSGLPAEAIAAGSCVLDIAIGAALVARWRPRFVAAVQLAAVAAYTAVFSVIVPGLWLDPLGPLLKNIPIVAAILVLAALEAER